MPNQITVPVPRTVSEWVRITRTKPTINDLVERVHMQLLGNPAYLRLLDGVYNEQAVEGSLVSDDHEAARIIREAAIRDKSPLGEEKLATIVKALRVVLKRYGMGRTQRRVMFSNGSNPADAAAADEPIGDVES